MVYLIHFSRPYRRVSHYIGYCKAGGLERRIERHRSGDGSRLMWAVTQAGIEWEVVRVWPEGDRNFERRLKKKKQASYFCPWCNPRAMSHGEKYREAS
jgi:predicted GIY-YIG superfamily endonuclease